MKKIYIYVVVIFSSVLMTSSVVKLNIFNIEDDTSVSMLLLENGDSIITSKLLNKNIQGVSAERGREIVEKGFTEKPGGGKSGRQSSHFVCTSCHNVEREDPDLLINNPLARLKYTDENGLAFLQATTLYGVVNRESYYNGDYELKYGSLVAPARYNIREAIQLCATECAQGRKLKDWEMESILGYFWEIDLKIGDLNLSDTQKEIISTVQGEKAVSLLKSKYLLASDATFVYPPENRKEGYPNEGNPENGKLIYKNGCLHCHYKQKYSFFHLDKSSLSLNHMKAKIGSYSGHSIYQVIRWGVPSKSGKHSYMPQFTEERMSNQLVEDLRAYLEQQPE